MTRTNRALTNARRLRAGDDVAPASVPAPERAFAIGDPQTTAARFLAALDARGLLGDDGWLRPDVRLVSMGDHFDYAVAEREEARVEGVLVLSWLAAHPRAQVTVLAGNHDLARVMELAAVDDARFAEAAAMGRAIEALPRDGRAAATEAFRARFPEVATPGYAARDYNAFTEEQRALVRRLLVARRFDLAVVERTRGVDALLTHAGVTGREVALLGVAWEARALADALRTRFEAAIDAVADDWRAGRPTPLSLAPLHVAGADGAEGGGMLYHRPADPAREGADAPWERAPHGPRRFDPRGLPRGLVQVVGHTGHRKAWKEMPEWRDPGMTEAPGGLRTLSVTGDRVRYARGVHREGEATVWMIDPEMHHVATPADVALLALSGEDDAS